MFAKQCFAKQGFAKPGVAKQDLLICRPENEGYENC
jgi:hypothetical protein